MPMRLLSILAVLFLVLSRSVVAEPRLFHDEANGYQIQFDSANLKMTPSGAGNELWYLEWADPSDPRNKYFNLHLTISRTTKTDTADVCQDMCWKISQRNIKSISKVTAVNILPHLYGFTWRETPSGIETQSCQYVVLDGPRAFIFTASTYPDQFNLIRPRWEKIISTLRFDPGR